MRRSTGTILLGGWLLLVPRDDVPMREWHQISAYDTARACEERKQAEIDGMGRLINEKWSAVLRLGPEDKELVEKTKGQVDEYSSAQRGMRDWRCLPAEVVWSTVPTPASTAP